MGNTEQLSELCGLLYRVIDLLTQIVNAEELTQNNDGGPGSGNHNHSGVPGQIGGSAPSAKQLSSELENVWDSDDPIEVEKVIRKNLKSMAIGQSFEYGGLKTVKVGEDEFESDIPFDNKRTIFSLKETANGISNGCFDSDFEAPIFFDAEKSNEEPEAYKGKGEMVDIDKKQFKSLRDEMEKHTGTAVSNAEIKEYLNAIDTYRGTDYTGVVSASAGFANGYERYASIMSEEDKAKAVSEAESIEKFIKYTDKYNGKVMRAIGFELGGDSDRGDITKSFQSLIDKCTPGNEIDMGHISSWTTDDKTIKQILNARTGNDETAERSVEVVFTCNDSKSGVDIGRFSKSLQQGEVIFGKNQKFIVKSVTKNDIGDDELPKTKYEIEVEEATSSYGMDSRKIWTKDSNNSVGVIVVSDGKILTGKRLGDLGNGEICGPGGHIENGETPEQAAVRETQEEFGITPKDLFLVGVGKAEADTGLQPHIFLCTEYDGEIKCADGEMAKPKFLTAEEISSRDNALFKPFSDSLELLMNSIGGTS